MYTHAEEVAMRESSLLSLMERRRVLLDQASAALHGHLVGLWRLSDRGQTVVEIVSPHDAQPELLELDLGRLLHEWGRRPRPESRWVGCRADATRWHIAPVRLDAPEPPPSGIERRSPERLVIELAGLSLGALERIWQAADQATVYLCAALEVLETCLGRVRQTEGLSVGARAHLLADLAGVADAIDVALRT
jgi:hypothetical protein